MKIAHRTLDFFEVLAREQRPMTLTELAQALDAPMSSCFELVRALRERGYLHAFGRRGAYYPTRKMLGVAEMIAARDPLDALFGAALAALRDATGETVVLARRQGDRVIYLMVAESRQTVRFNADVGRVVPLHTTASGKALLAALDDTELDETLARIELKRVTRASITDRRKLRAAIEDGRRRGFQVCIGENVEDVMAVASTVAVGSEPYAISLAGPVQRVAGMHERHAKRLIEACARLRAQPL